MSREQNFENFVCVVIGVVAVLVSDTPDLAAAVIGVGVGDVA